jgi:drug/metabolite transporter (DMT)-like permease
MLRVLGTLLVVLGVVTLVFGGIPYNEKHDVEFGPIKMDVRERRTVTIPRIAGAAAVVAGAVLFVLGGRASKGERTPPWS